ncbi:MAG TPA: hypothetical protein OIM45_02185 [Clostridiaceae bacterium]|nr:hypothetical protein [Clostridiaceae bacterium]
MNKKTIISILIILILLATCLVLTGCGENKKEDLNKEEAKLVDEYAPFEFTFKYPKDAGYEFKPDLKAVPYVTAQLINEEKNIKISFTFDKTGDAGYKSEKESATKQDNYSETNYCELGGYEYRTDKLYYSSNLLNTFDENMHYKVTVKVEKNNYNKSEINLAEVAKSSEIQEMLKSMKLNDQIEGKKVDGIISENHRIIVKNLTNIDENKYRLEQYATSNGVTSKYTVKAGEAIGKSVLFKIEYFGDEGNFKDLATYIAKQESYKKKFVDYTLFGQKVKVDVTKNAIGEGTNADKYKLNIMGYFEKDGKLFGFQYIQAIEVEDSLGEKLVNDVLSNFTIQEK